MFFIKSSKMFFAGKTRLFFVSFLFVFAGRNTCLAAGPEFVSFHLFFTVAFILKILFNKF